MKNDKDLSNNRPKRLYFQNITLAGYSLPKSSKSMFYEVFRTNPLSKELVKTKITPTFLKLPIL